MSTVEVYWNRTRQMWSVREGGKVVDHRHELGLRGCTFHVQPAGRRRVLASGQKNVHAWIKGELVENAEELAFGLSGNDIEYAPHRAATFELVGNKGGGHHEVRAPIHEAEWVFFYRDGKVVRGTPRMTNAELLARIDFHIRRTA